MRIMVLLRWFVLIVGVGWLIALAIQTTRGDNPADATQQFLIAFLFTGSGIYGLVRGDENDSERSGPESHGKEPPHS